MTRRRRTAAALLASCALLVAACGESAPRSDQQASYAATIRTEHADLDRAMSQAFAGGTLDATNVDRAGAQAAGSLEVLKSAEVPARHAEAHAAYVSGLETFADILRDVREGIDDPDVARRHLEDERFGTAVASLERASTLYRENGLDLDEDETDE